MRRPGARAPFEARAVGVADLAPLDLDPAAVDLVGVFRAASVAVRTHPTVIRAAEACEDREDRLAAITESASLTRRTVAAWSRAHPGDDGESVAAFARDHAGALPPRHDLSPF